MLGGVPSGFGSAQTYQSALELVRDDRLSFEPGVLVGGVRQDEVYHDPDAEPVRLLDERVEVAERAEHRVDVAVVGHIVAESPFIGER